jgi:hypothetical protein
MKILAAPFCLSFFLLGTLRVTAQSTISASLRYAYAANAGWLDFRPSTMEGAMVADTCLSGYAYAANFGWIHFGDGSPDNGHTYSNASSTDFGVNIDSLGRLTGFAYSANVGWINFEQAQGQPRIDLFTGSFTGHAYAANIGWLKLDTTESDLATLSIARPDVDADGISDKWERLHLSNLTTANATSDQDGDGASDLAEYRAGTVPTDANSLLKITAYSYSAGFTQASLTWTMVPTRRYRIEYDEDLLGPWTNSTLGTFTPPAGTTATSTVMGLVSAPRRFFRVVAVNPL